MDSNVRLAILGAGPAGLGVGHFARQRGIPFRVLEAADEPGGNARTTVHKTPEGIFRVDTGAHRFHDRIPEITAEVQSLLGDELVRIDVPSRIDYRGHLLEFPLSPIDLFKKLGPLQFSKAGIELLLSRLSGLNQEPPQDVDFETYAVRAYGRTIASQFLLNYSEKLWGVPCSRLSTRVGGRRIQGLNLRTFLREWFQSNEARVEHLDGSFLYPKHGIGRICDALAKSCGSAIRTGTRVTRILAEGNRIRSIEINGEERFSAEEIVSTLPMPAMFRMLDPAPPREITERMQKTLRFRSLVLISVFVDRESVSPFGSIYVPDASIPFTRVYEPRNRSVAMSPPGKTSLVAEIPCDPESADWKRTDADWTEQVQSEFCRRGWISRSEILGSAALRIPHAYPALELESIRALEEAYAYLEQYKNLRVTGRNGAFVYAHIHDMLAFARDTIDRIQPPSEPSANVGASRESEPLDMTRQPS